MSLCFCFPSFLFILRRLFFLFLNSYIFFFLLLFSTYFLLFLLLNIILLLSYSSPQYFYRYYILSSSLCTDFSFVQSVNFFFFLLSIFNTFLFYLTLPIIYHSLFLGNFITIIYAFYSVLTFLLQFFSHINPFFPARYS